GSATLLILFAEESTSVYSCGSGTPNQLDGTAAVRAIPVLGLIFVAAVLLSRRLDLLRLGDDAASLLGARIRSTLAVGILLAVVPSGRLDLLSLGDVAASVRGARILSARAIGIVLPVVVTATAVPRAGPVGFDGLCSPVIARLVSRPVHLLAKHAVLIPVTAI